LKLLKDFVENQSNVKQTELNMNAVVNSKLDDFSTNQLRSSDNDPFYERDTISPKLFKPLQRISSDIYSSSQSNSITSVLMNPPNRNLSDIHTTTSNNSNSMISFKKSKLFIFPFVLKINKSPLKSCYTISITIKSIY
jgi:hypothetical protein